MLIEPKKMSDAELRDRVNLHYACGDARAQSYPCEVYNLLAYIVWQQEREQRLVGLLQIAHNALGACTHEANDFNCPTTWEKCRGCEGDEVRRSARADLKAALKESDDDRPA